MSVLQSVVLLCINCYYSFLCTIALAAHSMLYSCAFTFADFASVARVSFLIAFVLDYLSFIWLWQFSFRPNWRPWGILVVITVNLAVSVFGYFSVKRQTPELEGLTTAVLVVTGISVALQAAAVAYIGFLFPDSFEPLVRNTVATPWWNWRRSRVAAQGTDLDSPPSQSRDSLQLDSLYHVHECIRKNCAGKMSRNFTPVSPLHGVSQAKSYMLP